MTIKSEDMQKHNAKIREVLSDNYKMNEDGYWYCKIVPDVAVDLSATNPEYAETEMIKKIFAIGFNFGFESAYQRKNIE